MNAHDVLDVNDAAAYLKRSRRAIYTAVSRKRLPVRRWGRRLVFLRCDLEAFLRALPTGRDEQR